MKRGQRGWRKSAGDQCGRGQNGAKRGDGYGGGQDCKEMRIESKAGKTIHVDGCHLLLPDEFAREQ